MKHWYLILFFSFVISGELKSQFYEIGQDPFSTTWYQINTKKYRLIFPKVFEKSALHYASTLDTLYPIVGRHLQKSPKKITVIFHTQSSMSNGMVVYAPKRMELFTIPPQDNYPQDWLDQLALHETRHVAQLDNLNTGITQIGSYILGQQAIGGVSGYVPRWFLEGDAVYSETMFSKTGRGRNAFFQMPYRALVVNRNHLFSYEKAMLGSYKDYVPSYYQLGYPLVKMGRDSFGSEIFGNNLNFTAKYPFLVFPFGTGLFKQTGLNMPRFYQYTFKNLGSLWKKEDSLIQINYKSWQTTPFRKTYSPLINFFLGSPNESYTNYTAPVCLSDSTVLVQKSGLSNTLQFIILHKSGKETLLFSPGSNNSDRLSVSGNLIVWSEDTPDLRWQNRTYSEIRTYDFLKKKQIRLTRKSWYFSPVFSPDGTQIAAIQETPGYLSSLAILNANSGTILNQIEAPEGCHLQYPVWDKTGQVFCMSIGAKGKSIIRLNFYTHDWETIIDATFQDISSYCLHDNYIIFAGELNGKNDLFIYNLNNKLTTQLTNSRFGAFSPYFDNQSKRVFFSEYTSHGHQIASIDWSPENIYSKNCNPLETIAEKNSLLHPKFNMQEGSIQDKNYSVTPYSKLPHLINIHSWIPAYYNYSVSDITNPQVYPGLLLLSQNMLGTLISTTGYSYENGYSYLRANISYKALYPVITGQISLGGPIDRINGSNTIPTTYSINLNSILNISLPLNLTRGINSSGIIPYVEWQYNRKAYYDKSEKKYYQGLHYLNWGLNYYRYRKMALRDLYPNLGFSTYFRILTTPFENHILNSIYAINVRSYLPGLTQHHSFQIRLGYQKQDPLLYQYSSILNFPRGYLLYRTEELKLINFDYSFPLCYPDFSISPLLYLKRIRTNFFFDMAQNNYHNTPNKISKDILRSFGIDIISNVHLMRIIFPFDAGFRLGYIPDQKSFFGQMVFTLNLVY